MSRLLIIFFSLFHFSTWADNFQVEGLSSAEESDVSLWSIKYLEIIKTSLGDLSEFSGSECRILISLDDTGRINNVKSITNLDGSAKNKPLCSKAISLVENIEIFPVPEDYNVRRKIREIIFLVEPKN
ncbi:cell envelope integrity protein TolA [Vibrio vulnificus]|nr:cell envelope integrity protein TolA [Vibrio vulnificus]HAT8553770.1 hypothetical protein [Vibrio vulnificus]